jgi:hypothetical protein
VIVAPPAATPVTKPAEPTVAIAGALLLHIPPGVTSLNEVVAATHTFAIPVIEAGTTGNGFTVTIAVTDELPQPFVSV